ncbi:putative glycosidase CRH2 [Lecanora helva]
MVHLWAVAAAALFAASTTFAQSSSQAGAGGGGGVSCGAGSKCPANLPCCSQYGQCGVGAYCLGGCDIQYSNTLDSCVPAPVCKSQDYKLTSLDGIEANTKYLGDATKADWVSSGTPLQGPNKDSIILTLSEDGQSQSGTLLASSHYVWYGKISATMKSSRGAGVVSAFILLSDVKDEIDFEFIGADLETAQSNYYFQGITNYDNGKNLSVSNGDTFSQWHTYEIDWQPDQLTWSVDGNISRTLKKSETFNKTDNQFHYPQSPARVELSLWPAGISKNGEGTVAWSGGLIDWNSQDVKSNGYYYSMFKDVNIQCYDTPPKANVSGSKSYIYTGTDGVESDISVTNDQTVLKSLLGTGTDMDKDYPKPAKPSGTKSAAAAATSEVATVPGLSGAGPGTDGTRGGGSTGNSGSGAGGASDGSQSSSAAGSAATGVGGFSQGGDGTKGSGSGSSSEAPRSETVMKGSAFAALVAFIGMLTM